MSISFRCERCHKTVKAPDDAAGKRGKCPYCGNSSYIPSEVDEDEVLSLAPVDEEEERRREQEKARLLRQEHDLLAESGSRDASATQPALENRDDLSPEDLYHFVVNYCLNMMSSRLEQAEEQVAKLRRYKYTGVQAVEDFRKGEAFEPALDPIPKKVLNGFLDQLTERLKA